MAGVGGRVGQRWSSMVLSRWHWLVGMLGVLICSATLRAAPLPGEAADWHGFSRHHFDLDNRACFITAPKIAVPGKPWVWRARFPDFHPEVDLILLDRGYHIAYINTDGMLGSDAALDIWDRFYDHMTQALGFSARPALEGVSRGGLFIYRWAARHPDRVACIYADTPVLDIKSWPLGAGAGLGHEPTWRELLKQYNLTHEEALAYDRNPIDVLEPIARAKIPLRHVVSLNDRVVPPAENTFVLKERYEALGGHIEVVEVPEGTPESSGHHFPLPQAFESARFVMRHTPELPRGEEYFTLRAGLHRSRLRFEREGVGTVAFLGGSITHNPGWREQVEDYLTRRFPGTRFEFINAGIPSMGSTPGAFRLERDVLAHGPIDLLLVEAAVNDPTNGRRAAEMLRGMEGIVRHARIANPMADLVVMHFVMPPHMEDYRAGRIPEVIREHERVAEHYGAASLDLAREVTDRIDAGQLTWEGDFLDLHPSPFGQQLYASSITRLLDRAWGEPIDQNADLAAHALPERPLDEHSYFRGRLVDIAQARTVRGFRLVERWRPVDRAGTRPGFADVPALVGEQPGASFTFEFDGSAVGLFVAAGPDAGTIQYRIDGGAWRRRVLFTPWSRGLHLPWAQVLEAELTRGRHTLEVRIAEELHHDSDGHAVRVFHFLVN